MKNQSVKDRLISYIQSLGISQRKFEITIGKANGFVNSISDSISKSALKDIEEKFPQLNKVWLMFGEGEMLNSETEKSEKKEPDTIYNSEAENPKSDTDAKLQRLNTALKNAFNSRNLYKKQDWAAYLEMNYGYFCGVTTGKETLTDSFLQKIQRALDINPDWILTGEGQESPRSEDVPAVPDPQPQFTASEPQSEFQVTQLISLNPVKSDTPKLLTVDMESLGKKSILEYMNENTLPDANIVNLCQDYNILYQIRTTSVEPYGLMQEDYLCLSLVKDKGTLINGKVYFVDSHDNGKMVKRLEIQQDSYVLVSPNSANNSEQVIKIPKSADVQFFRIVLRVTTNTDKLFSEKAVDMYYMSMAAVEANKGLIINERKAQENVHNAEENTKHALSIIDQLINK